MRATHGAIASSPGRSINRPDKRPVCASNSSLASAYRTSPVASSTATSTNSARRRKLLMVWAVTRSAAAASTAPARSSCACSFVSDTPSVCSALNSPRCDSAMPCASMRRASAERSSWRNAGAIGPILAEECEGSRLRLSARDRG